ncbi:MAG: hypothetical protein FD153_1952 [Rhodospirillaceae bacterium]|nr:MAG: hypothetical protein FD153_1952 [Rhodospirillaceae bacterium]
MRQIVAPMISGDKMPRFGWDPAPGLVAPQAMGGGKYEVRIDQCPRTIGSQTVIEAADGAPRIHPGINDKAIVASLVDPFKPDLIGTDRRDQDPQARNHSPGEPEAGLRARHHKPTEKPLRFRNGIR